jgi:hypothetical protein
MLHARRFISSCLSLALIAACNPGASTGPAGPAPDGKVVAEGGAVNPVVSDPVAELTSVQGPSGVRTEDLAEGTFLGPGAKLRAGQTLLVPRGTLAELRLTGGTVLRLNEESRLVVPDGPQGRAVTLAEGELVAIVAAGQPPLAVRAGDDTLDIATGEARVLHRAGKRAHDVVYGAARLRTGGQETALSPGSHVETPLATQGAPVQPEVSLRPLEDTAWSRTFEVAAAMADAVPPGVGSLTARRAGQTAQLHRLALVDQRVNVSISGRIARTEVEQTFYNEAAEVLEGTYRFPLPADASISGLSLLVGNTWMNAEMLEKERARSIFKQIVDATIPRDPALLEWEKGNIFKMKIFPIPGRGERKIRLSYTQVLPAVGDNLRYRYPIAGASSGATGSEIDNFSLTIAVDRAELPPDAALATPMARLERRELPDRVELSTVQQRFRPVHDLGVDIPLTASERRLHSETHLDRDGQAYFMLALRPDLKLPASDRPVHYAFVLDRSHSMTPELWTVARSLLQAMTGALGQDDRVTVLACDAACDVAPGGLVAANPQTLAAVDAFLDPQILAGASDVGGMMRAAADALGNDAGPAPQGAERVIVYLGDGNPSAGELAPDELLRHLERPLAGTRVQAVALGARSDLLLLDALTRRTGGDLLRADAKDDIRGLVRELRLRAEVPVARDVELTLPRGMEYVHPQKLAAVRPGDTVLLVGKLSQPVHGAVELRAHGTSGQVLSDSFQVDLEARPNQAGSRHTHLPRTWAALEIDALTANKGHAAREEIIDLSRQYTVLSRYTALLVLENDAMFREFNVVRQAGRTTGWNGQLGVGNSTPTPGQLAGNKDAGAASPASAARPVSAAESAPAAAEPPTPAPAAPTSTPADREGDAKHAEAKAPSPDPQSRRQEEAERAPVEVAAADEDLAADKTVDIGLDPPAEPAPATEEAKAKKEALRAPAKGSSKPMPDRLADDAYDGDYGGGAGSYGSSSGGIAGPGRIVRYTPRWKISGAGAPGRDTLAKLEGLRQAVLRDPTSRPAHRNLVINAVRAGAPDAFTYATAWSQADPDHAPALLAVADLLAARGDTNALRAYGSAAEVNPFNLKLHQRLAEAYAARGDLARSCAHRRAAVSVDPARPEHHLDLARCLAAQGRSDLVRDAVDDGLVRARGNTGELRAAQSGVVRPGKPRAVAGELKATVTWSGPGELDLAFIDHRGRRLSVLRPEGLTFEQLPGMESLGLATARRPVIVEVTRAAGQGPVTGELRVRTPEVTRTYPFTIDQGSLRLASVSFTERPYWW